MKKLLCILLLILSFCVCLSVFGTNSSKRIETVIVFNDVAITGSGSSTSSAIPLVDMNPEGYFSFILTTVGASSVVQAEYLLCDTSDGTYYEPYGAADIVTAHSPGTAIYEFNPPVGKYMKIKLTETSGNNVTSATGKLTVQ